MRDFHRIFGTGAACRQGAPTPLDTWSRPFGTCICSTCWDQSFLWTCRYFSGLCSSNIPRYFHDLAFSFCQLDIAELEVKCKKDVLGKGLEHDLAFFTKIFYHIYQLAMYRKYFNIWALLWIFAICTFGADSGHFWGVYQRHYRAFECFFIWNVKCI